jgi:hypothetical protein
LPFGGPSEDEKALLGLCEPPAFLRRGMRVDDAEARVDKQCETARLQMLFAVRLRLRSWNRLVHDHPAIRERMSLAAAESVAEIGRTAFLPREAIMIPGPAGWRFLAMRHWRALVLAVEEFNANWKRFLEAFPLDDLHRVIDDYNRYYVLEKECAVRSFHTARRGFTPRKKTAVSDLLERFPPLPAPPGDYRR